MIVRDKANFIKGLILGVTFLVTLAIMFTPKFGDGKNALEASDRLFNSISKGSTYFIPELEKKTKLHIGNIFHVSVKLRNSELAERVDKILNVAGAKVITEGTLLEVSGDLGQILNVAVKDSDAMFYNRDSELTAKYGFPGLDVMFGWWSALKEIEKDLTRQKQFKEANLVSSVIKRGIEVGYNFFNIKPESAFSRAGILSFALVFYVIYTLWWGFAILFLFEGIGLEMKAGSKREH